MDLRVECRLEAGERVPARFGRPGAMQDVGSVVDRWPGTDHSYFRVRTLQGVDYILRRDEARGKWQIHFMTSTASEAPEPDERG